MKIIVITAFTELMENFLRWGIVAQAVKRGLAQIECLNLRDYAGNDFGHIDDRPYGGGPGMVLRYQPLREAIAVAKEKMPAARVYCLSPQGTQFNQDAAWRLSEISDGLIFICGRYEGIDQRVIERWVDEEISIGPYVLSGGETACAAIIEACVRLLPGAVNDAQSVLQDSHSQWSRFDHPHYTRPDKIDDMSVPPVLLSGDHEAIKRWRQSKREQKSSDKGNL
ncbi:MAG: tRNA (guanosine(37)-N1)-methyltransferase TrmD [Gammaproteobacteria bacterium]|nr:tRNA (guanosine(37)-N1)-methyltransferase TrmD [Gammaproteobacteria bacterium]